MAKILLGAVLGLMVAPHLPLPFSSSLSSFPSFPSLLPLLLMLVSARTQWCTWSGGRLAVLGEGVPLQCAQSPPVGWGLTTAARPASVGSYSLVALRVLGDWEDAEGCHSGTATFLIGCTGELPRVLMHVMGMLATELMSQLGGHSQGGPVTSCMPVLGWSWGCVPPRPTSPA